MSLFTMKKGDLEPYLEAVLTDEADNPVDLSSASSVQLRIALGEVQKALRTCTVVAPQVGDDKGKVRYSWVAADTENEGNYRLTWVVTWPNTRPQTFPAQAYVPFRVEDVPA